MKIDRMKNRLGNFYDYCLMEGNKELYIFFAGNLDLYFLISKFDFLNPKHSQEFKSDLFFKI